MLKGLLAALAIGLLLAVLSLLTIESRSVTEDYYVAHANRIRAIETSKNDIASVLQVAQSAFGEGRSIPESVSITFPRLTENNRLLQRLLETSSPDSPMATQLPVYEAALAKFVTDGIAYAERQNALAAALRALQEESPIVVKELRGFNLRIQSQNTFSLAIDLIEFASGQRGSDVVRLQERIDELRNDSVVDSQVPGRLDAFADAATRVLTERVAAEAALKRVSTTTISNHLGTLSEIILVENRRTIGRAERARLLLSIFAVLLLVGAAYAMLKLQKSYRDLNRSNTELAKVNNSLEDRVTTRTEELSEAYENLKESQVQLVQAEKMSSLGELVAGISHEINTPLYYLSSNATVVQERLGAVKEFFDIAEKMISAVARRESVNEVLSAGLLEMRQLLSDGMKDDIDEAEDLIQDSIEGLEELSELAQSLKDFSRLDRAKQGEFSVNDGLNKTLLIAKNRIKNKVTVHKHFGDVPTISCSPSQINQIFLNLITNASDAIETTGELVLKTWQDGANVCVSVGDTGSGIPEGLLAKIRDPFFTTKEVGKGTGLGLSIVDQIVSSHNGELKIESAPGKGTVVTVILPIRSEPKSVAEADNATADLPPKASNGVDTDEVPQLSEDVGSMGSSGNDETAADNAPQETATA